MKRGNPSDSSIEEDQKASKRVQISEDAPYDVILLDIEGTTTSISFVADVLFPYSKRHLESHLRSTWDSDETKADVALLLSDMDAKYDTESVPDIEDILPALLKHINHQIANDIKSKALKQLQGHIWKHGYESKELVGHTFPDVKCCLESWTRRNYKVYIYSSGSVGAQKLLFGYSDQGDLLPYLSGHFDTNVGSKLEVSSYTSIANELEWDPSRIIFVTDRLGEAEAASKAGMGVFLSCRPGNDPLPNSHGFHTIQSFVDMRL